MKKPNFFIIGAGKCGTTSMAAWLSEHPKIFMSEPKEPQFFSTDINIPWKVTTLEEYLQIFQNAGDEHLAVGEASVSYLPSHVAVKNILEFNPSARFIVMLRNPIDMAPSVHGQWLYANYIKQIDDFEEYWHALSTEESLLEQADLFVNVCKLGEQVQRLLQTVDAKSVLFIVMEDLIFDPLLEYQRVLEFLDVPYDGKKQFVAQNTAKRPKNRLINNMLGSLIKGKKTWKPRIGWLIRLLKPIYYFINVKPHKTVLRPEFKQELIEFFKEDVKLLSSELDRDFTHWLQ